MQIELSSTVIQSDLNVVHLIILCAFGKNKTHYLISHMLHDPDNEFRMLVFIVCIN